MEAMREVVRTVRALRDAFRLGAARPRGEWPRWPTGGEGGWGLMWNGVGGWGMLRLEAAIGIVGVEAQDG